MDARVIAAIISSAVVILGAVLNKANLFDKAHAKVLKDLEIYNALPDTSVAKGQLLKHIDQKVGMLIKNDSALSRHPFGIVLAIIFITLGSYLTWFFIDLGSWWRFALIGSIFVIILGIAGFAQDVSKKERDQNGRPIKK